jgi:hypothetical protein
MAKLNIIDMRKRLESRVTESCTKADILGGEAHLAMIRAANSGDSNEIATRLRFLDYQGIADKFFQDFPDGDSIRPKLSQFDDMDLFHEAIKLVGSVLCIYEDSEKLVELSGLWDNMVEADGIYNSVFPMANLLVTSTERMDGITEILKVALPHKYDSEASFGLSNNDRAVVDLKRTFSNIISYHQWEKSKLFDCFTGLAKIAQSCNDIGGSGVVSDIFTNIEIYAGNVKAGRNPEDHKRNLIRGYIIALSQENVLKGLHLHSKNQKWSQEYVFDNLTKIYGELASGYVKSHKDYSLDFTETFDLVGQALVAYAKTNQSAFLTASMMNNTVKVAAKINSPQSLLKRYLTERISSARNVYSGDGSSYSHWREMNTQRRVICKLT